MNKPQKPSILFRAMIVSCALAPHCVSAKTQSIPFTPLEQMATLTNAASQAVALKLYHAGRQATIARQLQRDYRARYLLASPGERITIAMTIGEEGVERFAAGRPLKVLLPPKAEASPLDRIRHIGTGSPGPFESWRQKVVHHLSSGPTARFKVPTRTLFDPPKGSFVSQERHGKKSSMLRALSRLQNRVIFKPQLSGLRMYWEDLGTRDEQVLGTDVTSRTQQER